MKINSRTILLLFLISRVLIVCGCATIKQPKTRLVPTVNQTLPRMTLAQAENLRPIVYFMSFDRDAVGYKVKYTGIAGGMILEKDVQDAYKDTIRVTPIWWSVRAYDAKGNLSKPSKPILIE